LRFSDPFVQFGQFVQLSEKISARVGESDNALLKRTHSENSNQLRKLTPDQGTVARIIVQVKEYLRVSGVLRAAMMKETGGGAWSHPPRSVPTGTVVGA
jgi:hypothetical protein